MHMAHPSWRASWCSSIIFEKVLEYRPDQWFPIGKVQTVRSNHAVVSIKPYQLPCISGKHQRIRGAEVFPQNALCSPLPLVPSVFHLLKELTTAATMAAAATLTSWTLHWWSTAVAVNVTPTWHVLPTQSLDMDSGNQYIHRFAPRMDVAQRVMTYYYWFFGGSVFWSVNFRRIILPGFINFRFYVVPIVHNFSTVICP